MKPATYKRWFKKYEVQPVCNSYISRGEALEAKGIKCAACAVGIRIIAEMKSIDEARKRVGTTESRHVAYRVVLGELTGLSGSFIAGLDNGWESYRIDPSDTYNRPHAYACDDYKAGFAEGRAAAEACDPAIGTYTLIAGR